MNFFGHAAVAARRRDAPAFVLGAMLPDFCSMAGARPLAFEHREVSAGVAFHHATDAAFHATATFVALCSEAVAELSELGVRRGSARAAAHVGIELLLDGVLLEDPAARDAYLRALGAEAIVPTIRFEDEAGRARFEGLRQRLVRLGVPDGYRLPAFVAARLSGTLAHRPRLRLSLEAERAVAVWLERAQPAVARAGPDLLAELDRGLAPAGPAAAPRIDPPDPSRFG